MSYVTLEYYVGTFHGEPVEETDFPLLLSRAVEIVEEMCMYRIQEDRMTSYGAATQDRIRRAICAEIEYLDANGGGDLDNGSDLQSAGLGKFNYSKATDGNGSSAQPLYAPRAIRILAPTGLLYRGG